MAMGFDIDEEDYDDPRDYDEWVDLIWWSEFGD